jgi:hypothetical protein
MYLVGFEHAISVLDQAKIFRSQPCTAIVIGVYLLTLFGRYRAKSEYRRRAR